MRKLLTILAVSVCLGLVGCGEPMTQASYQKDIHLHTVEIESCEYFVTSVHGGRTYTHKGNCKNPIHSCQVK